ncbi:MAG TPA: AraC family transcriptional regulator [Microscillaceae bacterium]|nr:AraC family transcriptional regulator [Microscillaceae bacterium]
MKHISILIPRGQYSIVNIAGTFQILNWANATYLQQARKQLFEIEFVGVQSPSNDSNGLYSVMPMKTITQIEKTDLIIVPAVHEEHTKALEMNREAIEWLKVQHQLGVEIAAYCIGVFLLAQTGLLNGKTCSTHWGQAQELQTMFPEVLVQSEKIITACDGLYTSGGAYAFTNLAIYLIEKYGGRELAIMTAKAFMVDVDKNDQSLFMMFTGQKHHKDTLVLEIQNLIEQSYASNLSIDQLATEKATNRRTLERRFRAATGNSVIQYLQRVRVESAKKILEKENSNVTDAMYAVGYSDAKAFRTVFKKYVGVSPMAYKKKFSNAISLS